MALRTMDHSIYDMVDMLDIQLEDSDHFVTCFVKLFHVVEY